MTEEHKSIHKIIQFPTARTSTFSISLDKGYDKRIEKAANKREGYVSKSKIIEWALSTLR